MPTYQYACTACDHRFEAVQSFTDASLTECPACSGNLRKVFSSVGIVFKGSGFYRTDSRSGGGGVAANTDSKSDSGKSDSGKSDSGSSTGGAKETSSSSTPSSSSAAPAA
ncbi:FmdB family transcriptional regulator [Pseudonocardia sp. DSM 110487]|uniref:FmdB family zinc ribbon protein n=1 Tax=Pseudonocardia sp. DSM 110487 TaxID=2865833 RepID=UPI001C6A5655|nr:FmdB family zinc ribbon protein [Pseudonocardia sp. DSM 110487]QYN36534.1 FmdB family transcriptional regulator [Pseudonocardia sp. DSM 110487]